ncbi:MAG: hypothetical protein GY747_08915 [Planctomycetes bacterium]|nr:hypothetical protein [Planctomycetota bacterium]MCP4771308.1 hypothetical protein [Planctomycetota bacterium]MCP4860459.1 hypothetical protein [Planctomycetota bacterium]
MGEILPARPLVPYLSAPFDRFQDLGKTYFMLNDASGNASMSTGVPGRATGFTLYTQGADLASGSLTNSLAEPIL